MSHTKTNNPKNRPELVSIKCKKCGKHDKALSYDRAKIEEELCGHCEARILINELRESIEV